MRGIKLVLVGFLAGASAFGQSADVEKATLHYDLTAVSAGAAVPETMVEQKSQTADVLAMLIDKVGKKEKKIINKVLEVGEQTGVLRREMLVKRLGKINVPAIIGLYENIRSLKISGLDLNKVEKIRETLAQIDVQLKEAGIRPKEFGKLSFYAGLARDQLANTTSDPKVKENLRAAAVQNYQDTVTTLADEKDPGSQEKVADAIERQVTLQNEFGNVVPLAPAKGSGKALITSDFGVRTHPVKKTRRFHQGIDLAAWKCTGWPVKAIGPGRVVRSGWENGYGYSVVVSHMVEDRNLFTRYGHLKKAGRIASGKIVKNGDLLGYCNNSGISTGAHLHFEVREKSMSGITHDPKPFLPEISLLK